MFLLCYIHECYLAYIVKLVWCKEAYSVELNFFGNSGLNIVKMRYMYKKIVLWVWECAGFYLLGAAHYSDKPLSCRGCDQSQFTGEMNANMVCLICRYKKGLLIYGFKLTEIIHSRFPIWGIHCSLIFWNIHFHPINFLISFKSDCE